MTATSASRDPLHPQYRFGNVADQSIPPASAPPWLHFTQPHPMFPPVLPTQPAATTAPFQRCACGILLYRSGLTTSLLCTDQLCDSLHSYACSSVSTRVCDGIDSFLCVCCRGRLADQLYSTGTWYEPFIVSMPPITKWTVSCSTSMSSNA